MAVAAVMLVAPTTAHAGYRDCKGLICAEVRGSGVKVDWVRASLTYNSEFHGHFHIWGNGFEVNTKPARTWSHKRDDSYTYDVGRELPAGTWVCVEGWGLNSGRYNSVGQRCAKIGT
jgi:hypothetical protein